jgi:hypothetical protein
VARECVHIVFTVARHARFGVDCLCISPAGLMGQIAETELQTQHDAETHRRKMQELAEEKVASVGALQECTAYVE